MEARLVNCSSAHLPPVDAEGAVQAEPELILECRFHHLGVRSVTKILVKWRGAAEEDSTWVPYWRLRDEYPHLVGKVF